MKNNEEIYARYATQFEAEGIVELIAQVNTQEEAALLIYTNKNFKQDILDTPPKPINTNAARAGGMTRQFYIKDLRWTIEGVFGEVTDKKSAKRLTKALINFYLKD